MRYGRRSYRQKDGRPLQIVWKKSIPCKSSYSSQQIQVKPSPSQVPVNHVTFPPIRIVRSVDLPHIGIYRIRLLHSFTPVLYTHTSSPLPPRLSAKSQQDPQPAQARLVSRRYCRGRTLDIASPMDRSLIPGRGGISPVRDIVSKGTLRSIAPSVGVQVPIVARWPSPEGGHGARG